MRAPAILALTILTACRRDDGSEQARLEREFQETLSNAVLAGRFTSMKSGKITGERYTISSVTKVAGDTWLINARVQYGKNDYTVPVPVKVKWAGDTPVITMTDVSLPKSGTFTVRLLIFRGRYAGYWANDKGSGGEMFGKIEKAADAKTPSTAPSSDGPGSSGSK